MTIMLVVFGGVFLWAICGWGACALLKHDWIRTGLSWDKQDHEMGMRAGLLGPFALIAAMCIYLDW